MVKILDYDLEETKENQPDNNFLKPNESPMTSFLGPSRKSLAVPKSDLMSFDSPSTPKGTPRRSTRLSSAQKINYKETELFKKSLVAATAELNLFSPNTPRKRSPRSRSPSPALWRCIFLLIINVILGNTFLNFAAQHTVFENHRKSSKLRAVTFWVDI